MKKMFVILSILVIFLFVIYQVKSAKADTKNHDWINQEESVDDALIEKIKALTDCQALSINHVLSTRLRRFIKKRVKEEYVRALCLSF